MMSAWIIYDKNGLAKCEARQLQYSGEFMGACSINVNISSPIPIKFELGDWLEYRGERFELNYDPSVVKVSSSNTYGEGFQYENIVFNSLADELTRCDFLDYIPKDNELHYSSLPTFSFFADSITKLADRIQANLDRVYTDDKKWTVEVHPEYVNTLNVNITASNNTVWDALGFVNSKFGANFIIRGRKITIGTTGLAVGQLFSYGKGNGLYKIERNAESSQKIITRLRAYGSTRNMPTDYYKNVSGGNIPNNMAVKNLMLPSFPVQTHDPYIDSKNIVELGIREGTVFFDGSGDLEEIYPTMEGMTAEGLKELGIAVNATGRLDEVLSAEQISDNGKFEPAEGEEQVTIPDFTITLKDVGFNLNDYLGTSAATISMKDGMCGGRDFEIVSCEKEGDSYILACHRHYDESLDLYFPYNGYQIKGGDKFVLLNIEMPDVYIKAASQRLLNAATAYLAKNDYARYSYTLSVDNIFMARQHKEATTNEGTSIHDVIKEGDLMLFEDEDLGIDGGITISSLSIKEYADEILIPEYEITLQEEKTVGTIEKIQNQITNLVVNGGGGETVINTEKIKSIVQAVGSKLFLSKTKDDRSKGKVASDKGFEVGKFVAGASGAIIQVDAKNGQTIAELDKLYVRMKAYFETLEIINVNSIGGKMILSPAGSVTCLGVEELDDAYRCYFLGEQDGEIIENRWKEGMQAYSQMFNAKEGVSNKVSNTYYWRLVTAVSKDVVDFNNQRCHYIDLSKSDCDTNSDIPKVGDVINHRGCRNNADYMNFIEFSAVGTNAPYITLFQGVNSYSLTDKEYVSFGYDQSTGRAYMNVYGDMYFGNRDGSSYIKYNPADGLEVKGKLSVGTTYNGSEIGSLFDKQQEDLEKFTEAVTKEFENIRNEMDGAIDTWFGEETPTLGNYPAVDWTTNADKDSHLGDLFYTNDGKVYRFQYTESDGYYWSAIEDSEVVKALELAQKALDTADGKRRVFIEQPYTPYDLGDLWAAGESQPLMRCINARVSGSYYASDWAVADDSHAYTDAVKKDLQASINATKSELDKAIEDAEAAAKDYTDEGKAVLQLAIDEMEKSKANLDDVYTKAFEDDTITKLEARALEAAQAEAKAAQALAEEASAIYADGVVTKEEEARIEQAKVNLAEAKAYAEEKANEAFNNAMEQIAGYEYLKEALKEDTSIEGGIIQSSLIKLGYTGASGYVVMAGSNGTLDSSLGDKSIAFWAGGDMLDRENGSNVSNAADFLVRMDGSGYAAGGNLSWDINGKITADPMSFFVGEDTVSALLRAFTITYNSSNAPTLITPNAPFGVFNVNGAATFASTLSVNGDITAKSRLLLGDIPMYKSKDGVVYIDGNLVVKGGVTMYGVDSADIPSLIKSLPVASTKEKGVAYFDPDFFSVSSDGKVSFIGETGSGLDITALQNYLTQNSYLNVTEGDNRYLPLSGGKMNASAYISWGSIEGEEDYSAYKLGIKLLGYDASTYNYKGGIHVGTKYGWQLVRNGATGEFYVRYNDVNTNAWGEWKTIAFTNSNVASATKLQTARTIWGQSFDGTGNVSGGINNVSYIDMNGALSIHQRGTNYVTELSTENYFFRIQPRIEGTGYNVNTIINPSGGNVGIGTENPSEKLHVSGNILSTGGITTNDSVTINGIKLSKSKDGVLYLDGNLVVKGGVTMYGTDVTSSPSIFDSLPVASTTKKGIAYFDSEYFSVGSDGKVSFIGKTDGLNTTELQNYLTSNSYLNVTGGDNRYLKLSGGTMTGDIYLGSTTTNKIGTNVLDTAFQEFTHRNSYGYIAIGPFNVQLAHIYTDRPYFYFNKELIVNGNKVWHVGNFTPSDYLPLSGGTLTDDLNFDAGKSIKSANNIVLQMYSGVDTYLRGSSKIYLSTPSLRYLDANGNEYTIIHLGNIGDYALKTDGSNKMSATAYINWKTAEGTEDYSAYGNGIRLLGYNASTYNYKGGIHVGTKYGWQLVRNGATGEFYVRYNDVNTNAWGEWKTIAFTNSNVASATKLQNARTIWGQSFDGTGDVRGNLEMGISKVYWNDDASNYFITVNGAGMMYQTSYYGIFFRTGGSDRLAIDSTGNVGIGTNTPTDKLHVVGNTYLNGDVFADELNTFDVLPRTSNAYSCGNSSLRWYQMYSYIGDFSGAVSMGSTLNVTGMTTMTNATITGYLRLKDTTNYGRTIYFGDGELCYLEEASDDVLTIYANAGIKLNTSSTSYNVSINTNLLVSGGITMYSQRSLKNIQDERGLSLCELGAIKPIRYTWKDCRDNRLHFGGIADDIQQVLPEVVYKTNDGVLTMDYGNAAFAIASSLIKPVVDHEKRIAMLEEENKQLRQEVERLKSA